MLSERFLDIYNEELRYLRESGKQFADEHPQVARHLGMHADGVLDPFVERLLEGTAFLSSRIQEKLNLEHPEFALQMLSRLAPQWFTPIPSIATIALTPDLTSPQWQGQTLLPKGSRVSLADNSLYNKSVIFTTGRDVDVQPVNIELAECVGTASSNLPDGVVSHLNGGQAQIRLRFTTQGVVPLPEVNFDPMHLTLTGDAVRANQLMTILLEHCIKIVLWAEGDPRPVIRSLEPSSLRPGGMSDSEALLPLAVGELPGGRLLREYFAAPSRFYSLELHGVNDLLMQCQRQHQFEIIFVLDEMPLLLLERISAQDFRLFATPIINLYQRRCNPVVLDPHATEHQVVVDRLNPAMYEIHHLRNVQGILNDGRGVHFSSLPEEVHFDNDLSRAGYSTRRKEVIYNQKFRQSSLGYQEVFITLSAGNSEVTLDEVKALSIDAMICDRYLFPGHLQNPSFHLENALPINRVEMVRHPSIPRPIPSIGLAWQAIQMVAVNPLRYATPYVADCASLLRNWLALFANHEDPSQRKRITSLVEASIKHCFEHYRGAGPIAWIRGAELQVNIQSNHHSDRGEFLFGRVLHRALTEYCQFNQTLRFKMKIDGEQIAEWEPLNDK